MFVRETTQEQCQGSDGRIGHSLSAAALLLQTCIAFAQKDKFLVCSVKMFCSCPIFVTLPFGRGHSLGRIHGVAKEDQERRA